MITVGKVRYLGGDIVHYGLNPAIEKYNSAQSICSPAGKFRISSAVTRMGLLWRKRTRATYGKNAKKCSFQKPTGDGNTKKNDPLDQANGGEAKKLTV